MQTKIFSAHKKTITAASVIFLMFSTYVGALEAQSKKKIAAEITYTQANTIIKFRPFDYSLPSKRRRIDVLLGRKFGNFSVYGYWKFDSQKRNWLGARLDYDFKIPNSRFNPKLQVKFFQPLNKNSKFHYYFLPSLYYNLEKTGGIQAGLLGYGKKTIGEEGFFYCGPSLGFRLSQILRIKVSYGKNLFGPDLLLYTKLYFNFGH